MLHSEHRFPIVLSRSCSRGTFELRKIWSIRLFNSSEKRLARTLLLLNAMARKTHSNGFLPKVSQEMLAELFSKLGDRRP